MKRVLMHPSCRRDVLASIVGFAQDVKHIKLSDVSNTLVTASGAMQFRRNRASIACV